MTRIENFEYIERIRDQFLLDPDFLKSLSFFQLNKSFIHCLPSQSLPPRLKVHTLGIPFLKLSLRTPKLTTQGAQLIGPYAQKNIIEIDELQLNQYLKRQPVQPNMKSTSIDDGYCLVSYQNSVIGTGVWKEETKTLLSQWPKQLIIHRD